MDTRLSRGPSWAVIALTLLCSLALAGTAAQAKSPRVVAELFTSQGCSSCPPADALITKLNETDGVLGLTLNVDYWDYLGWQDTLAKSEHSERQRAYSARRGDRSVYTPQIVINGDEHVVGSHGMEVHAALERADAFTSSVSLTVDDMVVEARVDGELPKGAKMATVMFLRISKSEEVEIVRGENAGRTMTYTNVVRAMHPIGMWLGGEAVFHMPKSELMKTGDELCAVLIQLEDRDGPGAIIGADVLDWKR